MEATYDVFIKNEGRTQGVKFKTAKAKQFAVTAQVPNGLDRYKAEGFCGEAVFDATTAPEGLYELHCTKRDANWIATQATRAGLVVERF